jgi:lipopolysaccharide export system permease protein
MKIRQGITAAETTFPISLQELYEKNTRKKGVGAMTNHELQERFRTQREIAARQGPKKRGALRSAAKTEVSNATPSRSPRLPSPSLACRSPSRPPKRPPSVFLLSLVIACVYFFFIILADTVRNDPRKHPELLIWLPNLLFITIGGGASGG